MNYFKKYINLEVGLGWGHLNRKVLIGWFSLKLALFGISAVNFFVSFDTLAFDFPVQAGNLFKI